ncbi:hypothetical protein D3C78_1632410 [compost metagenome]
MLHHVADPLLLGIEEQHHQLQVQARRAVEVQLELSFLDIQLVQADFTQGIHILMLAICQLAIHAPVINIDRQVEEFVVLDAEHLGQAAASDFR